MLSFILRRLFALPITLIAVFTVVFIIAHLSPGGPWQSDLPVPHVVLEHLRAKFHADDPPVLQYLKTFGDIFLRGDLGFSYRGAMPQVRVLVLDALPVSLALASSAMVLAVALGVFLGVLAALWPHPMDQILSSLTLMGVSTPTYVSTPVLIVCFAVMLRWLPSGGWVGLFHVSAIIPLIALCLSPLAHIARYTLASVRQAMHMDHVLAAEAKGLTRQVLVRRHILRNGLAPVLTVIGDDFSRLIAGSFFVESIYGIPGIGRLLVDAISARDYPVIIGVSLVISALITTINLAVDIGYAMIDPRVTYG